MVGDLKTTKIWGKMRRSQNFARRAYCSLRNEMERNETKWKSVVCEMKICSLRNLEFWRSCKRKNNRGKLSPRTPFRNSCKGCYEVVWSRQLLLLMWCSHEMSFINWTTIFIVQIIIYFLLVSVLLHSCCITLISRSTCSFTGAGNSGQWFLGKFSGRSSL